MSILTGLGIALVLLFYWLSGHWFARVLMFLVLCPVGFLSGLALVNSGQPTPTHAAALIVGISAAALAWPLASLPIYYQRYQFQQMCARQRARGMEEYRML